MPSNENGSDLVVSDTSPILNLALIDRLDLLFDQFESIVVPMAVREELLAGDDGLDRLREFLESDFITVEAPNTEELVREFRSELDDGEATALALALETDAELVLIDERDGRTVARRHGLSVTGVVGILIKAARAEAIDIESSLVALRDAGFWISDDLTQRAIAAVERTEKE